MFFHSRGEKKETMNMLVPLMSMKKNIKNLFTKVGLYLMRFCSAYCLLGCQNCLRSQKVAFRLSSDNV